jgi:hypothetical protein
MRLLERRQISRSRHQTPLEFCQSLSFLPTEAYDAVCRMTHIFYRIRFGQMRITPGQQRHLFTVIHRLEAALPPPRQGERR